MSHPHRFYLDTSPSIKNRFILFWHCLWYLHGTAKEYHWIYLNLNIGRWVKIPVWKKTTQAFCWTCWDCHVDPTLGAYK